MQYRTQIQIGKVQTPDIEKLNSLTEQLDNAKWVGEIGMKRNEGEKMDVSSR